MHGVLTHEKLPQAEIAISHPANSMVAQQSLA